MQLKETQEALVAAAQEGVTIDNAISSLFPRDNIMRSSNVNPVLIGDPTDFAMFTDQHDHFLWRLFPTFVEYDVESGTYNYTIGATNDLSLTKFAQDVFIVHVLFTMP